MKLRFMLLAAVALSLMFTTPAAAQVTVVDRSAVALTYQPAGPSASVFNVALSYRFGPTWDLLLSSSSGSGVAPATVTRYGVRFHVRPPRAGTDLYFTLQAASETGPAASPFLVGAGFSAPVAPTADFYGAFTYHSVDQTITYDLGVQYQLQRQIGLVIGFTTPGLGYVGLSYTFR